MFRTMLKSKIHRATVTHADLHYVGSMTLDEELMAAADILPGEQVAIVDITNGARLETYAIPGPKGSGTLGMNGAAAHLIHPQDLVIVLTYAVLPEEQAQGHRPIVVHVDATNQIVAIGQDPAQPTPGADDQIRADSFGARSE